MKAFSRVPVTTACIVAVSCILLTIPVSGASFTASKVGTATTTIVFPVAPAETIDLDAVATPPASEPEVTPPADVSPPPAEIIPQSVVVTPPAEPEPPAEAVVLPVVAPVLVVDEATLQPAVETPIVDVQPLVQPAQEPELVVGTSSSSGTSEVVNPAVVSEVTITDTVEEVVSEPAVLTPETEGGNLETEAQ